MAKHLQPTVTTRSNTISDVNKQTKMNVLSEATGNPQTTNEEKLDGASTDSYHRVASLSNIERAFLSALLIDPPSTQTTTAPTKNETTLSGLCRSPRVLNDDILFSVPQWLTDVDKTKSNSAREASAFSTLSIKRPVVVKQPKDYRLQVGLWQAHEDGVTPKVFSRMASLESGDKREKNEILSSSDAVMGNINERSQDGAFSDPEHMSGYDGQDEKSLSSELEVRGSQSDLSWNEEDDGIVEHFDAWQVLKDEYAQDHGFDYEPGGRYDDEKEPSHHQFKIIGTSADDKSSHPHVVSPPLLASLMTVLPDVSYT